MRIKTALMLQSKRETTELGRRRKMSIATMLLTILAILTFCGLLQRVLDRMYLSDRQALALTGAMLLGTFLPDIRIGGVTINLGGCIIPLGICGYLLLKADDAHERFRALIGGVITGAAICLITQLVPAEAEKLLLDPIWISGLAGGVIAWGIGRSRRCAFVCGVTGVVLADTAAYAVSLLQGYASSLSLGGAGIGDAIVISGVTAVLLCELLGEAIERMARRAIRR